MEKEEKLLLVWRKNCFYRDNKNHEEGGSLHISVPSFERPREKPLAIA